MRSVQNFIYPYIYNAAQGSKPQNEPDEVTTDFAATESEQNYCTFL